MNYKILIISIVAGAVVVFGLWFWFQFSLNQTELENLPVATEPPANREPGSAADIESDLNDLNLSNLDADSSQMEAELEGL